MSAVQDTSLTTFAALRFAFKVLKAQPQRGRFGGKLPTKACQAKPRHVSRTLPIRCTASGVSSLHFQPLLRKACRCEMASGWQKNSADCTESAEHCQDRLVPDGFAIGLSRQRARQERDEMGLETAPWIVYSLPASCSTWSEKRAATQRPSFSSLRTAIYGF